MMLSWSEWPCLFKTFTISHESLSQKEKKTCPKIIWTIQDLEEYWVNDISIWTSHPLLNYITPFMYYSSNHLETTTLYIPLSYYINNMCPISRLIGNELQVILTFHKIRCESSSSKMRTLLLTSFCLITSFSKRGMYYYLWLYLSSSHYWTSQYHYTRSVMLLCLDINKFIKTYINKSICQWLS